ncbi:ribosomal RNA small subunit methyltransferase E [Amylibacter marinus]|uniref:Ribosomal RNA small subunit methyltransferase E n=1 Tax=Amylibacter marinus TaxID=1475483 RepID=A0ABQ5VXF4_9RHOB|nr:16S rRNA (uracil(1498)-N(3))-methyltransferase [Amylibacter marinus]GLQ35916.1 ribosomal RNA small subunit methyltransferase E [Amylibacter marinus]
MNKRAKIRLFLDAPMGAGQSLILNRDQANYLFNVMRLSVGDSVSVFNGQDGEWQARVAEANKRKGILICETQSGLQVSPPDLWLVFAPIKKARTDFIVEKATEMGAARILPVRTDFTNSDRMRQERLQAHAVEASEQCGGTYVPPVEDIQNLSTLLDHWPDDRQILFCDERKVGEPVSDLSDQHRGKWAILIGPEGGFSEAEQSRLRRFEQATSISLGPRILRADTAAVAALALWQRALGDWA